MSHPQRRSVELSLAVRTAIARHVTAAYPTEACGGLLGRERADTTEVRYAIPARNAASRKRGRYLIPAREVLSLERRAAARGLQLVGYYHSHPDSRPEPSRADLDQAWPWYTYLIVGVAGGSRARARAWRLSHDRRKFHVLPLTGERQASLAVKR